jgi:hypothetical protein
MLTNRIITMVVDELAKPDTQQRVARNVIEPMIKVIAAQMMPYALVVVGVLVFILLLTLLTFSLSLFFYLRRTNLR